MKTRLLLAGFARRADGSLYYTLLLLLISVSSVLAQTVTIRYVKAGGTGNGSSWASASGDLQAMINVSTDNDQVWVAAGMYKPTTSTDRTISFSMRSNLAIYGGFVGNETSLSARPVINPITGNPGSGQPSSTTLSGDIGAVGDNSDNSYHVINNFNGQTTTAILDGFVITGGNANLSSSANTTDSGGGMRNVGQTSSLIRNCSFVANSALRSGGAIYNGAPGCGDDSSPTLINCLFQANSARQGGAMANDASTNDVVCGSRSNPTLTNCSFISNSARFGGAMYNGGFGGYSQSSPTLTNCSFVANSAYAVGGGVGGAMYNVGTSKGRSYTKLINCSFLNNTATGDSNSSLGGAIANDGSDGVCDPTLTNCSFQGNIASFQGGAMYNTSVSNTTTGECTPIMANCVVFGNGGPNTFYGVQAYPQVYHSLLEASVTGWLGSNRGNLTATVSPFAGTNTTQLRANSPAINAGDPATNTGLSAQPGDPAFNAGATDLAGNPRIVGCKIDMGAFEFQYTFLPLAINAQPASSSVVCAGTAVSVPVSVSGTVSGYQWYKNSFSNPVAGQTSATLTLNNPQPGDAGSYSLVVTSTCNSLTSTAFTLMVNKPTISISPSSATVCQGQSALLTASGASSYTWSDNTTGNTLTATTTGTYSVTGVDGNGCRSTASAQVTVYRPAVSISPSSVSICEGQSALLTASGASSYTWSDNTTGNTLTATTTGTYSVTGVDSKGCSNTATASVTVNSLPTVSISASPSATITQGSSVTLTAVTTGATAFTWVTGSTSSSIVVSPTTSTPYSITARSATGCTASASLTITVIPPTCSPILYVTQQGAGLRDGSSWGNALGAVQLQLAINTAAGCGNVQVWVAAGVYKPTTSNDRTLSFSMRNGVAIYGGFTGTETTLSDRPAINPITGQPSSTTLSGDLGTVGNTGDNSFQVISNSASLSLTTTSVLDGFVITGGAGGTLGGGMFNDGSSPTVRNCNFVSNSVLATSGSTSRGGAMYNGNGSSPQLTNCSFQGNSISGSGGNASYGGAISNFTNSSPLLINCSFVNNSVSGSVNTYGGAMANNINSNPQLINCNFLNNSAVGGTTTRGGAINNGSSSPQLTNCSFLSNSVSGASTNLGGAIANGNTSVQLTNCVLFNNGGNNTFYNTVASVTASYSLFDNTVTGYTSDPTNLTASSSPFASTTSTQLATGSPAINTGSNQAYQSAGGPATDLAGNTRVVSGTIDMGAYEYQACLTTLSLTNPSATTAVQNSPFSGTFITSGGASPYSYSLASGTLPTGLTLTTLGVLSGTPTQTGSFSIAVRASDANGCSGISSPYTLTVRSGPVLSGFAASASSVCVGSMTTFTATVGNTTGSYSYTLTNGLVSSLTGNASGPLFSQSITAAGTGPQNFTLTVSANGQFTSSETPLTVNPLPTASLINNGPLSCAVTSVTLTAGGAAGVPGSSYTFTSGSGVLGTPGPANTVVVSNVGTYSVMVTDGSGCVNIASTSVTADQTVPSVSISSNSATLTCASPTVSLTAVGTGAVRWSTGETTPIISVMVTATYSVTLTGTNGCSSVASVSVSQDQTAPVASLVSSGNLSCGVTSVSLTASPGGQNYTFSSGATQVGSSNQAVVNATGTYSVTVLSANGCSAVASTSVSQDNTVPTASLTNNGPLSCSTTSVTLTASGGGTYRFSSGASQVSNGPTATVSSVGVYSVTVISGNGCTAVASVSVSQDNTAPTASLVSSGSLSCGVTSVTLTANPNGQSYQFSSGATQIGTSNQATVSTSGLYSVTVISGNGCSVVASVSVSQDNAGPTAGLTNNGPLSCSPTSVTLTASGGGRYLFSSGANQIGNGPNATVSSAGIYSVTVVSTNGCTSTTTTTVASDTALPSATLMSSNSLNCGVTSATLTATSGAGYTYLFSNGANQIGSSNQATVTAGGNYSVTVTSANGCSSTAITTVISDTAIPVVSLMTSGTLTCAQTSVTLTASASGGSGNTYAFSSGASQIGNTNQATVTLAGSYSVTVTSGTGCSVVATVTVSSSTSVATPDFATRGNQAITDGLTSVTVVQNTASVMFNATNCSGTLNWSGNSQTGTTTLNAPTSATGVFVYQATCKVGSCVSSPASVTVTITPANTAPVPTANANQTATVGQQFTYTANAFTDAETPNSLVYTASFNPANSLTFNPATRVIQGTPTNTGVTSVTITATDPVGLSASTTFTITVNPVPVLTNLTVLSRDPENGNLNTNTIKPYLLLQNDGTEAIPYGELTVRYYLTLENPQPLRFDINYAQMGNDKIHLRYVPLSPARQGASGYIEFSFDGSAGSLAPMSNAVIQDLINKQDYTSFFQGDDYSYVNNANFAANSHITAYRNGVLVYGVDPLPAGPPAPLGLTLTADPAVLLSTGNTTLTANVSGGTGPYSYAFSGPGTIQPNGNTANVSNLTAGVQTFTVVVTDATTPVNQTIAATVSVTVTTPANQLPVATANVNQTATVGQMVTYTVNAFTDDTPNSLTYTASINPANGLTLNPATRVIQGTPLTTGVSSVTITATDPGGLSASTVFTITVNAVPVAPTALTLTASASPATILATGTTTLTASVSGGTPGYTYVFSGPGTIQTNGNTATVSNLPEGVQIFTVTARDATSPVNQTIATTVSVTVSAAPNQAPVATANANQTATQGVQFSYTANAFTDAETPNSLTYSASIDPANGLIFNTATRMIQGTPQKTGLSSVTITATDPGGLSASTVFTINVLPAPVVTDRLTVYSRDPDNGQLNTNTLKPYLQLQNDGSTPIPYGELTVRYWLTVENPAPFRFEINYAQLGSDKVHLNYVPISPARQGASGYIEFSFDGAAGSLAGNSNSGPIQDLINKQDYSYFNQGDDYSYVNNPNFTPNPHITAYRNGVLIYGTEPPSGSRRGAESEVKPLQVRLLGNPVVDNQLAVAVSGLQGTWVRYVLTDMGGRLVDEQQRESTGGLDGQTLRLMGYPAGFYLLRVTTATQGQTVKVLKAE